MIFNRKHHYTEDDLDSIIAGCLNKDAHAQKILIKLFVGFAKSICLRYAGNKLEAEEIMNDGFLKLFNNLAKFDHSKPFKAWLRVIIINTAIDYFHKNQKHAYHFDIDDYEITDFSEDIISRIAAEEILALVQKLSPAYRMVFTLYVIDGYNHREIADMLRIKEGTSKSNLQDARRKLQVMIKNNYPNLHLAYALKTNKINEN